MLTKAAEVGCEREGLAAFLPGVGSSQGGLSGIGLDVVEIWCGFIGNLFN